MKQRLLLITLAVMASLGCVKAQNSADGLLEIPEIEIMQGKTALLKIMSNFNYPTGEDAYAFRGIQVELRLPEGISAVANSGAVGDYLHQACPQMTPGFNALRESDNCTVFLIYQVAQDNMPNGKYEIAYCTIKCDENTEPGEYIANTVKLELSDNYNPIRKYTPSNFSFKIKVTEYKRRILDDDITEIEENRSVTEDIQLNRSFKKDIWSTICLPFAMNTDQVAEVFGEGTKVAEFKDRSLTEDDKGDITKISVNFESFSDGIEANYPLIICPTQDVENITINDIVVAPNEDDAYYESNNGKTGSRKEVYGYFQGTLKTTTMDPYCLFISNNKFYITTEEKQIKAYRGYFWIDEAEYAYNPNSDSANITFFVDGEPTAIEGIMAPGMERIDGNVYTVSGVNMGRAEDVMNTLPSGIYIVNNKKVIVK